MKTYHSFSSEETKKFGADLAKQVLGSGLKVIRRNKIALAPWRGEGALTLALRGDLGAGKTTFAQGFLKGLGVKGRVSSPTFVLMKRFKIHVSSFKNAYHIDCYRVKKSAELSSLGLKEVFENPENIVLVEWPERLGRGLPKNSLKFNFFHQPKESERRVVYNTQVEANL